MQNFKLTIDHLAKIRDEHFSKEAFDKTVTTWDVYRKGAEATGAVLTPEIEALKEQMYKSMVLYMKGLNAAEEASDLLAQVENYFENTEEHGPVPEGLKDLLIEISVYINDYQLSNWHNPWISVETRLPESDAPVLFIVDCAHSSDHGKVLGGKYTGFPEASQSGIRNMFSTPGYGVSASHWMYAPKPNTDKSASK